MRGSAVEFMGGPFDGRLQVVHEGRWVTLRDEDGRVHRYEVVRDTHPDTLQPDDRAYYRGIDPPAAPSRGTPA